MSVSVCSDKIDLMTHHMRVLEGSNFQLKEVALSDQSSWALVNDSISHISGGFFHVLGVKDRNYSDFSNIVLYQPQSALTGLLIKIQDGVVYTCVQARAEPGNTGVVQFGPSIQSTAANYLKMHGGKETDFLEHFQSFPGQSRLLSFNLQTDLGKLYYQKSKSQMYVLVDDFIATTPNTVWIPVSVLSKASCDSYLLNTDLRSLLAMFDWDGLLRRSSCSGSAPLELLNYYYASRLQSNHRFSLCGLSELENWIVDDFGISSSTEANRSLKYYDVRAESREVTQWFQPLIDCETRGSIILYRQSTANGPLYLLSVLNEFGIDHETIVGPSVVVHPGDSASNVEIFGSLFRGFEHSEEGGRFINHESSVQVRNVSSDFVAGRNQFWVSVSELKGLLKSSNLVSIQLRVVVSALLDELNPESLS